MALASALIVCGAFAEVHSCRFLALSAVVLAAATWTGGLREVRTGTLDFYGALLVESACVLWCLSESWYFGAIAAFVALNMTIDIQFAVVGLHLYSTDIKLTGCESAACVVLPPLVIAASAFAGRLGYGALPVWIATVGFAVEALFLYHLMRRIRKRL